MLVIDKYFMRINEFTSPLNKFIATVRVKGSQARTLIDAESASQARLMLEKQYGEKNVVSVSHIKLDEQKTVNAVPYDLQHEKMVRYLTNKITRIKNRPRFTNQDIHKAVERYKLRQKRANLELQKEQELERSRMEIN
jgi:hypothetical protein